MCFNAEKNYCWLTVHGNITKLKGLMCHTIQVYVFLSSQQGFLHFCGSLNEMCHENGLLCIQFLLPLWLSTMFKFYFECTPMLQSAIHETLTNNFVITNPHLCHKSRWVGENSVFALKKKTRKYSESLPLLEANMSVIGPVLSTCFNYEDNMSRWTRQTTADSC